MELFSYYVIVAPTLPVLLLSQNESDAMRYMTMTALRQSEKCATVFFMIGDLGIGASTDHPSRNT